MHTILTGLLFDRLLPLVHEAASKAVFHLPSESGLEPDSAQERENAGVSDAAQVFQLSDIDR